MYITLDSTLLSTNSFITRFSLYLKVRMSGGMTNFLYLQDYDDVTDPLIPRYNSVFSLSFEDDRSIRVNYLSTGGWHVLNFPGTYEEDELLELTINLAGLEGAGYTRVTLNVNSTYVEDYDFDPSGGPVKPPAGLTHIPDDLIRIRRPRLLLYNNVQEEKYLKIYEL
jgi:hypothetical protein